MLEIERGGVQTRVLVAILVVVAGAAAAGVWIASGEPEPPTLPDVDLQGSPRPVVAHIEAAQQAVRDDPESAEVWGRLGASLEVHGFILEAVPCYDRAHVLQPRKWKWPYFLGYCHRGVDVAKAVAAFATAVKLKQDHAPLRVVYGDALLQTDQVAEAAGQYQTASEQDPRCAPAWKGLGAVALRRNDLEKAEEYLRRAIGIAPSYREPHQLLSQVHRRRGSEADADHELAQAKLCADEIPLPDSERDALGWYEGQSLEWRSRRSNQYRRAGQLKQAESEWRALLTFEPDSKDAHRELSALLVLQGRIAESKTHYDRARELAPGSIGPLVAYAEAHAQAGKNAEAITLFEEVLTKTPDAISARVNLGAILSRTGQRDRAINELNRIFEKDADNVPALFNLGAVYADALKWSEAAATFERLAKVVPSHPEVWDRWSLAVVRAGHPRQAIEILERGHGLYPGNATTANRLAWLLVCSPDAQLRNPARALALSRALCTASRFKVPVLLDTLAVALAANGDFQAAAQTGARAWELGGEAQTRVNDGLRERMRRRVNQYYNKRLVYRGPP